MDITNRSPPDDYTWWLREERKWDRSRTRVGKMENQDTQLTLVDQTEADVTISMDSAVTEVQVNAQYMASFERFTALGATSSQTRFGERMVVRAKVPDDSNIYVFTLTLPETNSKTAQERRAILDFFTNNPRASIADCALVAVPTDYGQPAYLWRSAAQAAIMRVQQEQRAAQANQQQAERASGLRGPAKKQQEPEVDIPL